MKRMFAEMEAGNCMKLIFCFATNCPRRIVRDELSATNCPATNCPETIHPYSHRYHNPTRTHPPLCSSTSQLHPHTSTLTLIHIKTTRTHIHPYAHPYDNASTHNHPYAHPYQNDIHTHPPVRSSIQKRHAHTSTLTLIHVTATRTHIHPHAH